MNIQPVTKRGSGPQKFRGERKPERFFQGVFVLGQVVSAPDPRAGEGLEVTFTHTCPWPPWITLLVVILSGAYVFWVYMREPGQVRRRTRFLLAAIRLALIVLVITMMYGWMRQRHRTDLPDIVLAVDDSRSMGFSDQYDDDQLRKRLREQLESVELGEPSRLNVAKSFLLGADTGWFDQLKGKYNLTLYLIGAGARPQGVSAAAMQERLRSVEGVQPASRLGDGIQTIVEAQRGRPTAAVVLLSDGVTTEGKSISEAAHYARRRHVPLFLVGVGNQRPPRDVQLSDLLVDETVFLGDVVNFDFKLSGSGFDAETVTARLKRKGEERVLAEEKVELKGNRVARSTRLTTRATEEGDCEYIVEVEPLRNETNPENNRLSRVVSVRDERIRVLYVQEYPSFDFRFLKTVLERGLRVGGKGKAIELTTVLQEADPEYVELDETAQRVFPVSRKELFTYDVVIFGDVNPVYMSRAVLENLAAFVSERGGGMMCLSGPRHTPLAYRDTPLANLLPIEVSTARLPEREPLTKTAHPLELTRLGRISPQMQLANGEAENREVWRNFPPLRWLLDTPDVKSAARVLVETNATAAGAPRPVVTTQLVGAGRVVFHATDESYLWSRVRGSEQYYERYWLQTIRYLSRAKLLGGNRAVEIVPDQNTYSRGETVPLQVRFHDERMAPVADDGVTLLLERREGQRERIKLRREPIRRGVFEGSVSNLAEGDYRIWMVAPDIQGDPPAWEFTVKPPPGEQVGVPMDADELRQAAKTADGKFYTVDTADRLLDDLPRGRQVRIESLPPTPVWNSPLLAALFVLLLVAEWLLRRRVGWR
ncbi:MAG: hypothetical protein ACODAD_01085 [Planctomycetota bacterium]